MKLLVDHNLSHKIAIAMYAVLSSHGHESRALREKFDKGAPDEEWVEELGRQRDWCVLTLDRRICRTPHLRKLWRGTDVVGFFLLRSWEKLGVREQTARLLLWWPRFEEASNLLSTGSIVEVPLRPTSKLRPFKV